MVGFSSHGVRPLAKSDFLAAGCVSGFISRMCVQPLDVVKIRFQLQVEPIADTGTRGKYRGIAQATRCILNEEGIAAFWKGHASSQLLAVSFTGLQFVSFELYTRWWSTVWRPVKRDQTAGISPHRSFVCGCLAGVTAAVSTQPLDVIKTRFVAQGEPRIYKHMAEAILSIAKTDGIRGLFRGMFPSILMTAPQTGLQFTVYNIVNSIINTFISRFQLPSQSAVADCSGVNYNIGVVQSAFSGAVAGISSKLALYPMDVAKKRLQVQGFEAARSGFGRLHTCTGLRDCLVITWKDEGPAALFKGLKPSLLKACVSIGCRFCVYEQVCHLLVYSRNNIAKS